MDIGMAATKKVTITLDGAKLARIQQLVASNGARSVSSFIQRAVDVALADQAGWAATLADALEKTGGPVTKAERDWASSILFPENPRARKRRRRAA